MVIQAEKENFSVFKKESYRKGKYFGKKTLPRVGRNKFILKKKKFSGRESMLNCQWFMNILLVLDGFLHYFLFYLSIQMFLHNFIQHIETFETLFCNHVSEIENFSALTCTICKISWRCHQFWSKKYKRSVALSQGLHNVLVFKSDHQLSD